MAAHSTWWRNLPRSPDHPQESLPALDAHWFAAARQLLGSGALSSLDIVANDRRFRITRHAGWRFWRRQRGWLETLAH